MGTSTDLENSGVGVSFTGLMTSSVTAGVSVQENKTITFTVTPSSKVVSDTVFNLNITGQALGAISATTSPSDFSAASPVVFHAGDTAAQSVTVTVVSDNIVEGIEAYKAQFLDSGFNSVGTVFTGTITDPTPNITLTSNAPATGINEGASVTYTATSDMQAPVGGLVIPVTFGGTAAIGTDYTAASSITIAAGATTGTLVLNTIADHVTESAETLTAALGSANGASVNTTPVSASINDTSVALAANAFALSGATAVNEGSSVVYTVTRGSATTVASTNVAYTITGSATAGTDYTVQSGVVAFALGATTGTITVPVTADFLTEGSETLIVTLGAVTGTTSPATDVVDSASSTVTTTIADTSTTVAGTTLTLTAGIDTGAGFVGTVGNDTFTANTAAGALTLTSLDSIDGGDGIDTLTASSTSAIDTSSISGYTVKNIENAVFNSTGTATVDTTSTWTGLTGLTVSGVGAVSVTSGAGVDVVASSSSAAATTISVQGGKSITLTASGVTAAGIINVGTTTAPAGIVNITTTELASQAVNSFVADAINVTGGSNVTINAGLVSTLNASQTVTGGAIAVTGNASTTSVTVNQTAKLAASTTVTGVTPGGITITDGNATTATDTITSVSLSNYGATTVASNVLNTVTLKGGTTSTLASGTLALNTTATDSSVRATALTLNLAGGFMGAISGTQADRYTSVNVVTTAASTITDVTFSAATTLAVSGSGVTTVSFINSTIPLVTSITSTGGGLVLASQAAAGGAITGATLGAGVTFTGGAGNDAASFIATTKVNDLGAGNNTAVVNVTALGTGGAIRSGAGTQDTLIMTADQAQTVSAAGSVNTAFATAVTGFERLSLIDQGSKTIDVAALLGTTNGNYVTIPAGAGALILNNLNASGTGGATVVVNGTNGTAQTGGITLGGTTGSGSSDLLNVTLKDTTASPTAPVTFGAITASNVENLAITVNDSRTGTTVPGQNVNTFTITDAALVSATVSGNQSLALTQSTGTALTSLDARGLSLGALTFTSNANQYATTVYGSALGNDFLNFSAATAAVNITENAGAATLSGGTVADTLNVSGASLAQIYVPLTTAGNGTVVNAGVVASGSSSTNIDTINGFKMSSTLGDTLHIPDAATYVPPRAAGYDVSANTSLTSGLTLTATATNSTGLITFAGTGLATATISQLIIAAENAIGATAATGFFVSGSDTYVIDNVDASATVGVKDIVVKLAGVSNATTLSTSAGATNIALNASALYNNSDNAVSTITGGTGADIIKGGADIDKIYGDNAGTKAVQQVTFSNFTAENDILTIDGIVTGSFAGGTSNAAAATAAISAVNATTALNGIVTASSGGAGVMLLTWLVDGTVSATIPAITLAAGGAATDAIAVVSNGTGQSIVGTTSTESADSILGGAGADIIYGGGGADTMDGGLGNDAYWYTVTGQTATPAAAFSAATTGSTISTTGMDIINVTAGDTIYLGAFASTLVSITRDAASQTGATAITAAGGGTAALEYIGNYSNGVFTSLSSGSDTLLVFDNNGSTGAGANEAIVLIGTGSGTDTIAAGVITIV